MNRTGNAVQKNVRIAFSIRSHIGSVLDTLESMATGSSINLAVGFRKIDVF